MDIYKWLEELEEGDLVALLYGSFSRRQYKPLTVKRITKTQIVTHDGRKWRKSDGSELSSGGYRQSIIKMTPDVLNAMYKESVRDRLEDFLKELKNKSIPMGFFWGVEELLDEYEHEVQDD